MLKFKFSKKDAWQIRVNITLIIIGKDKSLTCF